MCDIYCISRVPRHLKNQMLSRRGEGFRPRTDSDTRDRLVVGSRLCVEGAPEEEAQQHPTGGSGPCRYLITSLIWFPALLLPPKVVSNSKSQLFNLNLRGFHTRLW